MTNRSRILIGACLFAAVGIAAAAAPNGGARTRGTAPAGIGLEKWLAAHPKVRSRVAWVTGDGGRQEFTAWAPAKKERIEQFYAKLEAGDRILGMKLPDPEKAQGFYAADVAFDIYAAHVAHAIYIEAKGLVPWKLENHSEGELDELLNSNGYFSMIKPSTLQLPAGIVANRDLQDTPENYGLGEYISDPRIGYDFLSGKTATKQRSLIGKDELETLKNLTIWLRDNVDHGDIDDKVGDRARQLRWLDERLRAFPGQRTAMANLGCHSATKLMVDLARSVNIPLLNVRSLDAGTGNDKVHYFSRTHGSLVFAWEESAPRIVWHTDNIYAREGRICFPIDEKTGKLLSPAQADQAYFDAVWKTPAQWTKAGFAYDLERVFPDKGYGHNSDGAAEDRYEYGLMSGRWTAMGKAHQDELLDWAEDYALCGEPLLDLEERQIVSGQLAVDFKDERGSLRDNDAPRMPTLQEFETRAAAAMKALGGTATFDRLVKEAQARRGEDLLKPGVGYDGRKR